MKQNIFLVCAAVCAVFTSCSVSTPQASIEGMWLQPVPGQKGALQGMCLAENGEARSVNMHTLLYRSWSMRGDKLTLRGTSIGNKTASDFSATYTVVNLTPRTLALKNGLEKLTYFRARK